MNRFRDIAITFIICATILGIFGGILYAADKANQRELEFKNACVNNHNSYILNGSQGICVRGGDVIPQ